MEPRAEGAAGRRRQAWIETGETCGNRLAVLDVRGLPMPAVPALADLARALCAGPDGVDDLLVLEAPSGNADARFFVVGADGRRADLCGNGLLSAADLLAREGADRSELRIESLRGLHRVRRSGTGWQADIGVPMPLPGENEALRGATGLHVDALDTGEPHAVVDAHDAGIDDLLGADDGEISRLAAPLLAASTADGGINVTFTASGGPGGTGGAVRVRTFERGVGRPTLSCGTGAAAAAFVRRLDRLAAGERVTVVSRGGAHGVELDGPGLLITASPSRWRRWTLEEMIGDRSVRAEVRGAALRLWSAGPVPDAAG